MPPIPPSSFRIPLSTVAQFLEAVVFQLNSFFLFVFPFVSHFQSIPRPIQGFPNPSVYFHFFLSANKVLFVEVCLFSGKFQYLLFSIFCSFWLLSSLFFLSLAWYIFGDVPSFFSHLLLTWGSRPSWQTDHWTDNTELRRSKPQPTFILSFPILL